MLPRLARQESRGAPVFLPQHAGIARWIWAYFGWQFATTGSIAFAGGILRTLEGQPEGIVLFPVGTFLIIAGFRITGVPLGDR